MVSGLLAPSRGEHLHRGHARSPRRRRSVGYMFQKDTLLEWRTVLRQCPDRRRTARSRHERARRRARGAAAALRARRVHAQPAAASFPAACASARRWRARCARSPTCCCSTSRSRRSTTRRGSRSPTRSPAILAAEDKTVILVTHDIGEAISMADRVDRDEPASRPHQVGAPHRLPELRADAARRRSRRANAPSSRGYFQTIWDELDLHQVQ